jgi:D-alanyl-lipoteichoic acid acyltransferase DltB (MBOAT superfamily)
MNITSITFVLLSIASIYIFYLLNNRYRILFLVIISCAFVASYSVYLLLYILGFTLINYYIGLKIPVSKAKKVLFRSGIILNLLQLLILRYSSFAIDPILRIFNSELLVSKLSLIIVPIGISYITLQGIGYLINIKMGWEKSEKNFLNLLLYMVFYPKFLSGPIERSNHFLPQLKFNETFNQSKVEEGLRIVLFGFFKKIAIANQMAPYVLDTYKNIDSIEGIALWIILLIGPLYLYFDFSGYTDIAIGFAKALGINLLPNFNRPFFSENMTTFWKRFHISLSSWFNDYVFRQLSFKIRRWGLYASVFSLLVTWTLFGIWHGAGWNFMMLGFVQALAIIYEFFTKKWRISIFSKVPEFPRIWFGRIITYLFYCGTLVFFYSDNLSSAFTFYTKLTTAGNSTMLGPISRAPYMVFIYIPIIILLELLNNDFQKTYTNLENAWFGNSMKKRILRWSIYSLMIILILVVRDKGEQFIYVNF